MATPGPIPLNTDGSVSMQADGGLILGDADATDLPCCCGCPSPTPCSVCTGTTPLTIGVLLPALTGVGGPQHCAHPLATDIDFTTTGSMAATSFCLTQETPCLWSVYDLPFSDITVSYTSPEAYTTDRIYITLEIQAGPQWRVQAYLVGTSISTGANAYIFDTGWVSGDPPCTAAKTIAGVSHTVCDDLTGADAGVWAVTGTGNVTATPCCNPAL
jgi:hypothetical protein